MNWPAHSPSIQTNLDQLLTRWTGDPDIQENVIHWEVKPPREAQVFPVPPAITPALARAMENLGYSGLYEHQLKAYEQASAGRCAVIATSTASGKTLCYNLPVFDALLRDPSARAMYIFPTKALAHDQQETLTQMNEQVGGQVTVGAYDGDTPGNHRNFIRENARILLTNPDMLHMGILP